MNQKQKKWIIGIAIFVFILCIGDIEKMKSFADILGGIGSFFAFCGVPYGYGRKVKIRTK